jgi:hypothetical protein
MEESNATRQLKVGLQILAPILESHGFVWAPGFRGQSSGGYSDSGTYVRGDRCMEVHFRGSLGLITYHVGQIAISHVDWMRHTGHHADAKYPGFSEDPLQAFRNLSSDLESFGRDFLSGDGSTLRAAKVAADAESKLHGFQRMRGP